MPTIGDPKTNLGPFVLATLRQPEKTLPGRFVVASTDLSSFNKLLTDWSTVTGKTSAFLPISLADYEHLFGGWGSVEGRMLQFYNEFGSQVMASEDHTLDGSALGVPLDEAKSVLDTLRDEIEAIQ